MFSSDGRITDTASIRAFVTAGKATFTILNPATSNRKTFRLVAGKKPGFFFAYVRDQFGFDPIATIYPDGALSPTVGGPPDAIKAFLWIWNHLDAFPPTLHFFHEGTCARCGRPLTDPDSITAGYGPECLQRLGIGIRAGIDTPHPANSVPIETLRRKVAVQ